MLLLSPVHGSTRLATHMSLVTVVAVAILIAFYTFLDAE
jgi:hypothetical protein